MKMAASWDDAPCGQADCRQSTARLQKAAMFRSPVVLNSRGLSGAMSFLSSRALPTI
jgi:hypothetical protein